MTQRGWGIKLALRQLIINKNLKKTPNYASSSNQNSENSSMNSGLILWMMCAILSMLPRRAEKKINIQTSASFGEKLEKDWSIKICYYFCY